jgi:uncharacterized protein (DUF1330 family)
MEQYQHYMTAAAEIFPRYNAKFLARGGEATSLEGKEWQRHVVIEFGNVEQARACYNSPEYTAARQHRDGACEVSVTIVEGQQT